MGPFDIFHGAVTKGAISVKNVLFQQILEDAEKLRSKNNLLLNSCRLSLQHLNKVQLLANIDEEGGYFSR